MLTYQQIEKIPKVDTHVSLRMDEYAREKVTSSDGLYELVSQYVEQALKNNVVLAELVYTPEFYTVPMEDGLAAVTNAILECSNNNLSLNLSVQFVRDEDETIALERLDILSDWFKWNRRVEHIISGITIGSFWNQQPIKKYEKFLLKTKNEFPKLGLSLNMELNPKSKNDLIRTLNLLNQIGHRCEKVIINGFGTNAYEEELFRDDEFTNAIFSDHKPLVISPRKSDVYTVSLEEQILRIKQWISSGKRIIINTDDHFRETNKYGNFNKILENAFVNYDKTFWTRTTHPFWSKDDIVTFMKTATSISRNLEYNSSDMSHRFQKILDNETF